MISLVEYIYDMTMTDYDAFIHFYFAGTADCSTRENCQNIFLWTFMDRVAITHVREQRGGDTGTL